VTACYDVVGQGHHDLGVPGLADIEGVGCTVIVHELHGDALEVLAPNRQPAVEAMIDVVGFIVDDTVGVDAGDDGSVVTVARATNAL
jgi:hypothetical protein